MQAQSGRQVEAAAILKEALETVHAAQTAPERWPSCPKSKVRHMPASAGFYVAMLCNVPKAQAKAGLKEDAAASLEEALQFIPTIKDSALMKADISRGLALPTIAEAQNEAGLKSESAATFERAVQALSAESLAWRHSMVLARLARLQNQAGFVKEAADTFGEALKAARAIDNDAERAIALLRVGEAQVDAGLAADASFYIALAQTARSIADESRRATLLSAIARAQEKAGLPNGAAVTYAQALDVLEAEKVESTRSNLLFQVLRGLPFPGSGQETKLIAESAPQVVRVAESIKDELRRSEALVVIARALPN